MALHPIFGAILDAHLSAARLHDRDPREPDPTRDGIFRDHRCWRCQDGAQPCAEGAANRCSYPRARND